ncbi:hypothetical protein LEL_09773 [Akanthomyces lecanii RCEF 1005]|uniref:Uncharacterized protein n=1 Tax=Akanthomyces lecanii RCEF 1005 TaxID=1081108 RepID=A0A168BD54_CORDF|nr:hypothetical protein LEL_09773 [Akanthomyces lecanii RCEF 1005]
MFSDRELRRLAPPKEFASYKEKKVTAHFRTDPSLVGVAKDIKDQFATAGRTIRSGIIGSDPHPAVVGPAIGLALGVGAFMDLVYRDAYRGNASSKAHTSEEWAKLWDAVADWVYEYEAASLEQGFIGGFSYKRGVTDADRRSIRPGDKIPKGYLATDAIDAADAVHSAFKQLAAQPMEFYGMEWDFLELEMSPGVKQQFYARFGTKPADNLTTRQCLFKEILNQGPDVRPAAPAALHVCPVTLSGADWEEWFLAVKGGQVIMPATVFQVVSSLNLCKYGYLTNCRLSGRSCLSHSYL